MALTTSLECQGTMGSRHFECWKITGDASTTTFNPRLACVDTCWIQSKTGASCNISCTISSGVITFDVQGTTGALEANDYWFFILGSA